MGISTKCDLGNLYDEFMTWITEFALCLKLETGVTWVVTVQIIKVFYITKFYKFFRHEHVAGISFIAIDVQGIDRK